MYTPLDQFDIINLISFRFLTLNFSFTNSSFFICYIFALLYLFCFILIKHNFFIPKIYQLIIEKINNFIYQLLIENVGIKFIQYFKYVFVLFIFLLMANLLGMIPYVFTITSHLIFTFALSFCSFLAINIIGVILHGFNFLSLFLPGGAPLVIAPFLIVIEIISYIARVFSLAIRLFANIMSGHTLLKILSGFCWVMLSFGGI